MNLKQFKKTMDEEKYLIIPDITDSKNTYEFKCQGGIVTTYWKGVKEYQDDILAIYTIHRRIINSYQKPKKCLKHTQAFRALNSLINRRK
jgi:hypothetical protein